jgi:hypothetical protein
MHFISLTENQESQCNWDAPAPESRSKNEAWNNRRAVSMPVAAFAQCGGPDVVLQVWLHYQLSYQWPIWIAITVLNPVKQATEEISEENRNDYVQENKLKHFYTLMRS